MFCESYRQPLIDAAVLGEALPAELAAHLAACRSCASAFAVEQSLFSCIDRSLQAVAGAEVPGSLVPRVRTLLVAAGPAARQFNWVRIFVPLAATVGLALFLAISRPTTDHWVKKLQQETSSSSLPSAAGVTVVPRVPDNSAQGVLRVRHSNRVNSRVVAVTDPVSRMRSANERAMLQLIRIAREQPAAAQSIIASANDKSLTIKPIEVTELAWAPLSIESDAKN